MELDVHLQPDEFPGRLRRLLVQFDPHLDDAALSCGGRMLGDQSVLVVNVFNTGAWWRFPHGPEDAPRIQACRQREEALVDVLPRLTRPFLFVALEGIVSAENVGVIVRNASAFGATAVSFLLFNRRDPV